MLNFQKTSKTLWGLGVFLFAVLTILDQAAKHFAGQIFKNQQFAFSLPLPVWLMYIIYFAVIVGLLIYCKKSYRQFGVVQSLAWLCVFTGAVLNVGERLVLGYVRDFIYVHFSGLVGVYNLADFYILAGIVLLLFYRPKNFNNS